MIRVVITSVGATGAQNVIKALRKQTQYPVRIVGCDASWRSAGRTMTDDFHLIPFASDPLYTSRILDVCRAERADILIPIMEGELENVAAQIGDFAAFSPVVSPLGIIQICNDKALTQELLSQSGIKCPALYSNSQPIQYPVIVKPRKGTGSSGIKVCYRPEDLPDTYHDSTHLIQAFISGKEYTVDAYCDRQGTFVGAVPRLRLQVKGGLSSQTLTLDHPRLIELVRQILGTLPVIGPSNLQFIETESGDIYFIEINPRFGGAFIASMEAGLNAALFILNEHCGDPIIYEGYKKNLLMMRYWQEVYETDNLV